MLAAHPLTLRIPEPSEAIWCNPTGKSGSSFTKAIVIVIACEALVFEPLPLSSKSIVRFATPLALGSGV